MNSLAIVALPAKDDYVYKISSEKVPHLTLLFLGDDATKVNNLPKILDFVGHAAKQSLLRFGLEVDKRGELGPELADVLFFSKTKWSGFETVNNYRSYLLKDNNIRTAYDSATQFPEFTPHLTLGYPATPAKPDNRDYPGISYVQFDRIAVWFGDYEGIEFPLKAYEWDMPMDMAMSDITTTNVVDDILKHFGKKGMRWGIRRDHSPAAVSRRTAEKKNKQDEKFIKKSRGNTLDPRYTLKAKANYQVNKAAIKAMKPEMKALNKKPEYNTREAKVQIKKNKHSYKPDPATYPIAAKYHKETSDIYMKNIRAVAPKFMKTSASGRLEQKLIIGKEYWQVDVVEVKSAKHSDMTSLSFKVRPIFDDEGYIIDFEHVDDSMMQTDLFVDDFFEHYGKKGMRWGIRTESSGPQNISVKGNRFGGKKLRTSGGKGFPAHADAVRARTIGQKGKKSGLKALSNQELQAYSKRLNMEQNVKRLNYNEKSAPSKFIATLLGQTGKNSANAVANDVATHQVKKHLTRHLVKIGAVAAT